jgi:hypothetical protein
VRRAALAIAVYVAQTKWTAAEVADNLSKQVVTYPLSRNALVDRLVGKDTAFRQSTGKAGALRATVVRMRDNRANQHRPGHRFRRSGTAAPHHVKPKDLETIRTILLGCLDRAQRANARSSKSTENNLSGGLPSQ